MMKIENMKWTREPASCILRPDCIEITTKPHTDLWQRTYYHFQLWYLCLQSGGLFFYRGIHRYETDGMCVESA